METSSVDIQKQVHDLFFSLDSLPRTITVLCTNNHETPARNSSSRCPLITKTKREKALVPVSANNTDIKHEPDTILSVLSIMLSQPLQMVFLGNGVRFFKNKDLMYPYHALTVNQKECLLEILTDEKYASELYQYELCLMWKPKCTPEKACEKLDNMLVLKALCNIFMNTTQPQEQRRRSLLLTNLYLQKIHSVINISRNMQAELNRYLFGNLPNSA